MNGVLPFLKPPGMTSQQAVSHIRRILGVSKAGHTGTLDPLAAGVLPVCIGRATKLSNWLMDLPKVYFARLTLGKSTDTLDAEGKVLSQSSTTVSREKMEAALPLFIGEIMQLPRGIAR